MLFRTEFNMATGQSEQIEQRAYRNEGGETLVLDADQPAPEGFTEFDPSVEPA